MRFIRIDVLPITFCQEDCSKTNFELHFIILFALWNELVFTSVEAFLGNFFKTIDVSTRRPRTSGIFSAPNLFEKDYWTTNLFLVDSFQHSNLQSLSKLWQKLHKNFENWKILGFLSFSVSIWYIFPLENSHYLFGKAYWTTNSCHSCHVERFQHSNPRSLSKICQKLHKNVKNRKILEFFLMIFGVFFFKKTNLSP